MSMQEFKHVLSDFHELGSLALKGAVAAPLVDLWLKIGPSPTKPIAVLSSLTAFLAVVWVFQSWYSLGQRRLKARMKAALGLFCFGLGTSLVLLWTFTISPGQNRERVIEGFSLLPDVKPLIDTQYTPLQALRESEYDPDKVWTKESIVTMRAVITFAWIQTFVSFAVYLTVFVILQRRDHAAKRNPIS